MNLWYHWNIRGKPKNLKLIPPWCALHMKFCRRKKYFPHPGPCPPSGTENLAPSGKHLRVATLSRKISIRVYEHIHIPQLKQEGLKPQWLIGMVGLLGSIIINLKNQWAFFASKSRWMGQKYVMQWFIDISWCTLGPNITRTPVSDQNTISLWHRTDLF